MNLPTPRTTDVVRFEDRLIRLKCRDVTAAAVAFALLLFTLTTFATDPQPSLDAGWLNPPRDARLRAYWWWLNGNVTAASITRDLEEMKDKGFGGALICDADGSSQDGNERAPHGPTFATPEWRELFKHTIREADRLGLELSLNIQSGWNLGGPGVTKDDAPKKLTWTEARVTGPKNATLSLPTPRSRDGYYRDLFVLAWPANTNQPPYRKPLQNADQKALLRPLQPFSAPDSAPLFQEYPSQPNEADLLTAEVQDLTGKMRTNGVLQHNFGAGEWHILRLGCTLNDHCRVSTCSEGWDGYALDPFDAEAFRRYWDGVVEPLLQDAKAAGNSLKYLHTDSWEVEVANWTPALRQEFEKRRGYDLIPWLPAVAGKIVNSREESNRFLHDLRRTFGDLAIDNHYQLFRDGARRHHLLMHPESGGPHAVPIDAQQCLGFNDAPMSEFWAWSWRHRVGDPNRFFVKQPASAAHTYGHKLVLAEGFTTIGPHWQETLWDNLKPSFDFACTEGLNLLVWHAFVCSPAEMGLPGQQYFAGTHLNPNVTWWQKSRPFFDYINRCQFMLQQGVFVADIAYYYGNHVPNFARLRASDPARLGMGYDYDVITEEVILKDMSVASGNLTLPSGMQYRALVLPNRTEISLPVLRKIEALVSNGACILGPKPLRASGLAERVSADSEVKAIAEKLWDKPLPKGRVIRDKTARELLEADKIPADFDYTLQDPVPPGETLHYIHRRHEDTDIYFVANRTNQSLRATCKFRLQALNAELWNPVTGERTTASISSTTDGCSGIQLDFNPCGSWFVVFRPASDRHPPMEPTRDLIEVDRQGIQGSWTVRFETKWGGPASVEFPELTNWADHSDSGIKYYSGQAVYEKRIQVDKLEASGRYLLDLGNVRELAEVRVNGRSCGIAWSPPFRVDITGALKPGENTLQIEVVNFWPNRVIGDAGLPTEKRLTQTNIRKLTSSVALMPSGLLGPVTLVRQLAR
jgi:hypothetical protein